MANPTNKPVKPRIGGTKPKWKPKREVHHDRVIDTVVVRGLKDSFGEEIWNHTFYIEQWGEHLIAANEYTNLGRAKVYSEQIFNVFQCYDEKLREFQYFYTPARKAVAPRRLWRMEDLLEHAPWETKPLYSTDNPV